MAPKKKKGKKGKKGREEPEPEDHYMVMKGDQLEITITNLKEKLQDAKVKRNMLQIEKDMIHDFYHNTREEIKELDSQISNFDTNMQDSEEKHRANISSHMQKVKHLEYEHMQSCGEVKSNAAVGMDGEKKNHDKIETDNLEAKNQRKEDYTNDDLAYIAEVDDKEKFMQSQLKDLMESLDIQKSM
jgi:hypothetical protein